MVRSRNLRGGSLHFAIGAGQDLVRFLLLKHLNLGRSKGRLQRGPCYSVRDRALRARISQLQHERDFLFAFLVTCKGVCSAWDRSCGSPRASFAGRQLHVDLDAVAQKFYAVLLDFEAFCADLEANFGRAERGGRLLSHGTPACVLFHSRQRYTLHWPGACGLAKRGSSENLTKFDKERSPPNQLIQGVCST